MATTFTTRELARTGGEPEHAIWFQTTEGKVTIEMSDQGLLTLHGLVSEAVKVMKTDSERAEGDRPHSDGETPSSGLQVSG